MESLLTRAREVFAADRYAALTGVTIRSVGVHEAVCTLILDERHRNARGMAMGGVLFTLADFAAAVAANSGELADELHWVSLDSTIHFLAPADGNGLEACSTALKAGRTTALYQTAIKDAENDKTLAIVETTMVRV